MSRGKRSLSVPVGMTWTRTPTGQDVDVSGSKPHALFYVRTYCAALRKRWTQCMRNTGCIVVETIGLGNADDNGHYHQTVYRVVGTPEALDDAAGWDCVLGTEFVANSRVPMGEKLDEGGIPYVIKVTAQGSGAEKLKPKPKRTMQDVLDIDGWYADGMEEKPAPKHALPEVSYCPSSPPKKPGKVSASQDESHKEAREDSYRTHLPTTKI